MPKNYVPNGVIAPKFFDIFKKGGSSGLGMPSFSEVRSLPFWARDSKFGDEASEKGVGSGLAGTLGQLVES